MKSGTPKDLYSCLVQARLSSQERSPLAANFSADIVSVSAHQQSAPSPSFLPLEVDTDAWAKEYKVRIRYSRLVEPVYPDEIIDFVARLRSLSGHPSFVRLNRTKQLGTTSLSGNIGASHSRLEHSLGVLDIALLFCNKLSIYFSENALRWEYVGPTIIRAIALLAFIHDAFHGPYGHTMDPIRHIIDPACASDRLDKSALVHEIRKARSRSGWLWDALSSIYGSKEDELRLDLETLDRMVAGEPELAFALEIVDSAIDADRLDYIPRDHAHLFLGEVMSIQDIVERSRFFPDEHGYPRLHFSEGSRIRLMRLLEHRIFLYDTVYEAVSKLPYDEMLLHAVLFLFEDFQAGELAYRRGDDYEWRQRIAEEFSRLSDEDLERVFERISLSPKLALARLLLQDVRANAPFRILQLESIRYNGIAAMRVRVNALTPDMLKVFATLPTGIRRAYYMGPDLAPPRFYTARLELVSRLVEVTRKRVLYVTNDNAEFEVLQPFAEQFEPFSGSGGRLTLGPVEEEYRYWMCLTLADNIQNRRAFEFHLWRRFQKRWRGYDAWRDIIASKVLDICLSFLRERGAEPESAVVAELEEETRKVVDENSLIFVSATRIPPTIADIVLRHKSKEGPIRLYNEKKELHLIPQPYKKEGPPSYHIVVCVPSSLDEDALVLLREIWVEAVDQWQWYDPSSISPT